MIEFAATVALIVLVPAVMCALRDRKTQWDR